MTDSWSRFAGSRISSLAVTVVALLGGMIVERVDAAPITIGKIPAHRTVKLAAAVKVNENTPRSTPSISTGFTVTSADFGTTVVSPLVQSIFFPPLPPTVVTLPDGGTSRGNTPSLAGTADPNTTIEVFDGESSLGTTTVDAGGNWSFTPPQGLSYGVHTFTIRSTDSRAQATIFTFRVTIDCPPGLFGPTCAATCPGGAGSSACSGHGTCSDGLQGTGACTCTTGFFDAACDGASLACQVDTSDHLYTEAEWGPIQSVVSSRNRVFGNPFFWRADGWNREERQSTRFLASPKAWFAIADVKSCLGYRSGVQVLNLFLRSDFPLASYYDSREGENHRLGTGPLPQATVPDFRRVDVVWKLMPSPVGAIYYIVQRVQLNKGDYFGNGAFGSLSLYKESSGEGFTMGTFAKQDFDATSDSFVLDLGGVGATAGNATSSDGELPAIEAGVDLLKFTAATGLPTSRSIVLQVITQSVDTDASGAATTREIDRTGMTILDNLSTELALPEPVVTVKQSDTGRVSLRCDAPDGARPKSYLFRLTSNSTNRPVYYPSKTRSKGVRASAGPSYRAACFYFTKSGERSSVSTERSFKAKRND